MGTPSGPGGNGQARPAPVSSNADQRTMLDDKTAMVPGSQYGEGQESYKWRKQTRNYLVGRTRCMLPFLDWVERQTEKITNDSLASHIMSDERMSCIDRQPADLSHGLWAFLSLNLVGDPKRKFDLIESSNWDEVWRKVVGPLVSRSEERRHFLFEFVVNPKGCIS